MPRPYCPAIACPPELSNKQLRESLLPQTRITRTKLDREVAVERIGEVQQGVDAWGPTSVLESRDGVLRCRTTTCQVGLGKALSESALDHLRGDRGKEPPVVGVGESTS